MFYFICSCEGKELEKKMIVDVEGRQAREIRGKAKVDSTASKSDLCFSPHGLAPRGSEMKPSAATGRAHLSGPESKGELARGRKHIDMVHQLPTEQAKRAAGKIGKKKVPNPPTGKEEVLKIGSAKSLLTAEQKAVNSLKRMAHSDPTAITAEDVKSAELAGGSAAVKMEKTAMRRIVLARAAEQSKLRLIETNEAIKRRAPPSSASKLKGPIVADGTVAEKSSHTARKMVQQPKSDDQRHLGKMINVALRGELNEAPYDTAFTSGPYPPLQPVGVAVTERRRAKGFVGVPDRGNDLDTIAAEKAKRKAPRDGGMPDFLFGHPPPPAVKASPLRAAQERRSKEQQDQKIGRAADPSRYKPTTLW